MKDVSNIYNNLELYYQFDIVKESGGFLYDVYKVLVS